MINPQELRRGNHILLRNSIELVLGVLSDDSIQCRRLPAGGSPDCFAPVPLTIGLLKLCGFRRTETGGCEEDSFKVTYDLGSLGFDPDDSSVCWMSTELPGVTVKWLHELQNLYHILTGEDISIDLFEPVDLRLINTAEEYNSITHNWLRRLHNLQEWLGQNDNHWKRYKASNLAAAVALRMADVGNAFRIKPGSGESGMIPAE